MKTVFKFYKSSLTILSLGILFFTSPNYYREYASIDVNNLREVSSKIDRIDDLLVVKKSYLEIENDLSTDTLIPSIRGLGGSTPTYIFIKSNLPSDVAYKIIPTVKKGIPHVEIHHTNNAFKDVGASIYLREFLKLISYKTFNSPASFHEYIYNARANSKMNLEVLIEVSRSAISLAKGQIRAFNKSFDPSDYERDYKNRINLLEIENKQVIYDDIVEDSMDKLNRKSKLSSFLENFSEDDIRNLIMRNDRKTIANIFELMLPWEDLSYTETRFWKISIEAMRNPVPLNERIILYRGIGVVRIHNEKKDLDLIDEYDAFRDNHFFQLSNFFNIEKNFFKDSVKNYSKLYSEQIYASSNFNKNLVKNNMISTLFYNHSADSEFSPLISVTPDLDIAHTFGKGKLIAIAVDPRLLNFNYAATLFNEVEFLVPFLLFPEDILAAYHSSVYPLGENVSSIRKYLTKKIEESVSKHYGEEDGAKYFEQMKKNTIAFVSKPMENSIEIAGQKRATVMLANNVNQIYNEIEKIRPIKRPSKFKETQNSSSTLNKMTQSKESISAISDCQDMMKNFNK